MMDISRPLCGAQGAVEQRDAHTWGCIRYRLPGAALQVQASNPTSRTREMPTSCLLMSRLARVMMQFRRWSRVGVRKIGLHLQLLSHHNQDQSGDPT